MDGRCEGYEFPPRTIDAGALHGHVDEPGVPGVQLLPARTPALEHAGREVLDQHVCLLNHRAQDIGRTGGAHVQRDAVLRPVPHARVRKVVGRRADGSQLGLHLDDVGAEIGHDARGERAGEHMGEVDDAQAVQRERAAVSGRRPFEGKRSVRLRSAPPGEHRIAGLLRR